MTPQDSTSRREFLATGLALAVAAITRPAMAREATSPDRWQLGCYTRPWDRFDYRVALDGIAEAGFPYAGLMTAKGKTWVLITPRTTRAEAEEIGAEVKQRKLQTISVYGEFKLDESPVKSQEDLRRLIEHCVACGSPNLLLGGTENANQYATYYQAIASGCDFAAKQGVHLSIKPHGGQNATGLACRKAIDLVGRANFGLWYDPGNIFYYSRGRLDPVDDAATVDGLVVGMSVKDFRAPDEVMITPGTGRVNFEKVFSRLQKGGFTHGPLVVECLTRGNPEQITAEARKALGLLKGLIGSKS